jgi:hypothetical protein
MRGGGAECRGEEEERVPLHGGEDGRGDATLSTTCGGALDDSRCGRFAPQSPPHSPESTASSVPIAAGAE